MIYYGTYINKLIMNIELKNFLINKIGVDAEEITDGALIEDDLGIYGGDAVELLIAYGKEFKVDVSNFMAADYFSGDGDVILPALIRFFTGKKKPQKKALTVGHLEIGITVGRLDEDVINK
jgi:acyl carrier protein